MTRWLTLPFALIAFAVVAQQGTNSVTLAWDPSPGPDIAGYSIYYGTASGSYGAGKVTVGNVTNAVVTGLTNGVTYYFVATATDTSGLESDLSNEVSYTVPGEPPPPVPCTQTNWITSFIPGTLRTNYSGWVGLKFRVGARPLDVRGLGRVHIDGNTNPHTLRLVRVSDGVIIADAAWVPAGETNQISYAQVDSVILQPNTEYILASQEVTGGDAWYSYETAITTTDKAAAVSPVYSNTGTAWVNYGTPGNFTYGPVGLLYCLSGAPPGPRNLRVLTQ